MTPANRLAHLESVRGLAAVAVVVSHVLGAFAAPGPDGVPTIAGLDSPAARAVARLLTGPVGDGRFAVTVFFVLSGVVLAQRPLRTGAKPDLVGDCVRRYVRLAGPAAVACLLGWAAWRVCRPGMRASAELLAADGVSTRWLGLLGPPDTSLSAAAAEAGWELYRPDRKPEDHELFNPPLWTIRVELYGSLLVFGFLALFGRHLRVGPLATLMAVGLTVVGCVFPALFLAGIALAAARLRHPTAELRPVTTVALLATAAWLAGLTEDDCGGRLVLGQSLTGRVMTHDLLTALAAVPLVGAVLFSRPLATALSVRPLVWLGAVSFGLYLVHLPVLLTVGCGTFAAVRPATGHGPAVLTAGAAVLAVSLAGGWAATLLVDRPSVALGRALAARLTGRTAAQHPAR